MNNNLEEFECNTISYSSAKDFINNNPNIKKIILLDDFSKDNNKIYLKNNL